MSKNKPEPSRLAGFNEISIYKYLIKTNNEKKLKLMKLRIRKVKQVATKKLHIERY